MPEPLMRASMIKSNVDTLHELGEETAAAVRARVADVLELIEGAAKVAWLPLELDVELTEAVGAVAGIGAMRRWSRESIAAAGRSTLLKPILTTLQRMGFDPHMALGRVRYSWTLIYRNCGEVAYERVGAREARLVSTGTPEVMRTSTTYLEGISGTMDAVMEIGGGIEGATTYTVRDDGVTFVCRW